MVVFKKESLDTKSASDLIGAGRVVCGVQYNGASFHGWQKQNSGVASVQAVVESAISNIANENIAVVCAGRTDARVHATGQVVHFETSVIRKSNAWLKGINSFLPAGVSVDWVKNASPDFHARFSATSRRYRYLIYNDPIKPALLSDMLTWSYWSLDEKKMHLAAQYLVGEQDFTSFRASGCQAKSPRRSVHFIKISRKNKLIEIDIQANAFLHHMVRNIVGVLLYVGSERQPVSWVKDVLAARSRSTASVTAPPFGLYLVNVEYPPEFDLPLCDAGPFFLNL